MSISKSKVLICGPIVREHHFYIDRKPAADTYSRILDQFQSLGGSAAFGALVLSNETTEVTVYSPMFTDEFGIGAKSILESRGIHWVPSTILDRTPTFYSFLDATGSRWVFHEKTLVESTNQFDGVRGNTAVLLYPCHSTLALHLSSEAKREKIPLLFAPSSSLFSNLDTFRNIMGKATWLFLNENEMQVYTGITHFESNLDELRDLCPNIIITSAERGAWLINHQGIVFVPTSVVIERTTAGCGDLLVGAFCLNYYIRREDERMSLEKAQMKVHKFLQNKNSPLESTEMYEILKLEG